MQKGANFTIVSTKPLIGLKQKIFFILIVCFLTNFLVTKSRLGRSNTDILCKEHVKIVTAFLDYCLQLQVMIGRNL